MAIDYHIPVLVQEVVRSLKAEEASIIIDATLGDGGHTQALLEAMPPSGRVVAFEMDSQAIDRARIRLAHFNERLTIFQSNFSKVGQVLTTAGVAKVDGLVADLGVSHLQISNPEKGFMFSASGPLRMKMSTEMPLDAEAIINDLGESELDGIIREFGEEREHKRITRAIVKERMQRRIRTTDELASIVRKVAHPRYTIKTLARVFQAIRISVNSEIENLQIFLPQAINLLRKNGIMAIISYHSLEDRAVKEFMHRQAFPCECPPDLPYCVCGKKPGLRIIGKLIKPGPEEIAANPNARSAKLRVVEKF